MVQFSGYGHPFDIARLRDPIVQMSFLRKERIFVSTFLFLICLVMAQAVHNGWYEFARMMQIFPPPPGMPYEPLFGKVIHIPDAYRVAIPALAHLVMRVCHTQDTAKIAAAFDFVSGFLACYLFYRIAVDRLPETERMASRRLIIAVLFLAIIQFPVAWIVPWQRPETLPTSLFLAIVVFSFGRLRRSFLWVGVILAASLVRAFVRADVPLVFGVALVVLSLLPGSLDSYGSRRQLFSLGSLIVLISGGIQAYLQFVRFRNLHPWPTEKVIALGMNLHSAHLLLVFFVASLPFLLFAVFLAVKRPAVDGEDRLILIVSALYLALWFMAGVIGEVRLYVPFMMALSTVAARVLGSWIGGLSAEHDPALFSASQGYALESLKELEEKMVATQN
jgi:hypothetical protein